MFKLTDSVLLPLAAQAKFKPKWYWQVLLFLPVMGVITTLTNLVSLPAVGVLMLQGLFSAATEPSVEALLAFTTVMPPWFLLFNLAVTAFELALPILYCRFLEKRSIASMGLGKSRLPLRYLAGYAAGAAMLTLCTLMACLCGAMDISLNRPVPVMYVIAFFLGFALQGAAEEVLCRGYFMLSLSTRMPPWAAVWVSAAVFALLHIANPGLTLVALVNLILFGAVMGVLVLRTGSLWEACALHSAWNFFQGNIFGIQVSGLNAMPSVFAGTPAQNLRLLSGGSFGLEGSVFTTLVLAAAMALLLLWPAKKQGDAQ